MRLVVNNEHVDVDADDRTLLVHLLRDALGLTGTKIGCDTSRCGACTVLLDGLAVKSCTVLAAQCESCAITTVEGLAADPAYAPLRDAFREHHALQCGFCTPGFLATAADVLAGGAIPDEMELRHALDGNLCRCTGYEPIVDAILAAAAAAAGPRT